MEIDEESVAHTRAELTKDILGLGHQCEAEEDEEEDPMDNQESHAVRCVRTSLGEKSRALMHMCLCAAVPVAMMQCLEELIRCPAFDFENLVEDLDFCELFAGQREVSKAFARGGYKALPIEKDDGRMFDVISPPGQYLVLHALLRLKLGAAMLAAPVCSTWIWLTRNTTLRGVDRPLGYSGATGVREANMQAAFLLSWLWFAKPRVFCG